MIKAKYYYKDCVVGAVKFDHDRAGQPLDTRVITANAPAKWDVCRWDQGEIQAPRKKRKPVEAEESTEITVSEDE
jgi:hypothetical protein